jgi:hypothetical protein
MPESPFDHTQDPWPPDAADAAPWPEPAAVDGLIREAARLLFALCRADSRAWLSEGDLQAMYYGLLRRELAAHGLPACAVHAGYPVKITEERLRDLGKRGRMLRVDAVLMAPQTIHPVRGRRWEGQLAAAIEIKRGFERWRGIRAALGQQAAIREAQPAVQPYMLLMGYHSRAEHMAAVERAAQALAIPLLQDNIWGLPGSVRQNELPPLAEAGGDA